MHSVVSTTATIPMLNQCNRIKWFLYFSNCFRKLNGAKPTDFSCSQIICTDSRLQGALNPLTQSKEISDINSVNVCFPLMLVKDGCKLVDHRYFKPIPTEIVKLEDFMQSEEFKNILAKSSFYYNVDFNRSIFSGSMTSSTYIYSFDDIYCNTLSTIKRKEIYHEVGKVFMDDNIKAPKTENNGKPTEQQLLFVIDRLTHSLLNFFDKPQDFSIYHENIVFQNNIKGVVIRGRNAYIQTMYLLKMYGFVLFTNLKVEILKITHHIEDGTVRVRWRVKGVYHHKVLLYFWKLKSSTWHEFCNSRSDWLDGFSVFSVGPDGLIYKHVCDKMTPSDESAPNKRADLKSRLLGLLQLPARGAAAGSLHALVPCSRVQEPGACRKWT